MLYSLNILIHLILKIKQQIQTKKSLFHLVRKNLKEMRKKYQIT